LVEATGKKATFLREVTGALDLHQITVIHARAEELAREGPHRETYDVVTARAVASLPALLELGAPLLRLHGYGLFPKGLAIATELVAAEAAASVLGVRLAADERLAASATRLIVVEKMGPTPDRYPRRSGIPAREPLGVPRSPIGTSQGRSAMG
jgi:16S rRNA (guanine527-N7)-methyltransferase